MPSDFYPSRSTSADNLVCHLPSANEAHLANFKIHDASFFFSVLAFPFGYFVRFPFLCWIIYLFFSLIRGRFPSASRASWKTADLVQWLHRVVHSRVFLLVNASHFSWPFGRWGLSLLCGDTLHPRGLAPQQAMNSFGPNCKLRPAYDDRSPGLGPGAAHSARVRLDAERGAPSRPPSSGFPSLSSSPADPDPSHAPCSQRRAGVTVRVPTAPVTAPRGPRDVAADT